MLEYFSLDREIFSNLINYYTVICYGQKHF